MTEQRVNYINLLNVKKSVCLLFLFRKEITIKEKERSNKFQKKQTKKYDNENFSIFL